MLRVFVVFLLSCVYVKSHDSQDLIVRIYSNLAEIVQPLDQLPLEFTTDDWNYIRPDSITLVGKNLNVTSQSITQKKNSINGAQVYVRSPIAGDRSAVMFLKATIVDENRNLVKLQDQSVAGEEALYFTVHPQDIFYLTEPSDPKFYVDFTYTASNSAVHVSYLRTNIKWQTQYQLNLHHDKSDLVIMANIQNDGKSSLFINKAELFGGDTNLHMAGQPYYSRSNYVVRLPVASVASVESSRELIGTHIFTIDKPFMLDGQTTYLLPISRPQTEVERYHLISKSFGSRGASSSSTGIAQRAYRLTSDQYLTHGSCIIRESNRIVGETVLPDLAATNKHEFSIGQDAEVTYAENITYVSSETVQEAAAPKMPSGFQIRYIYQIDVQVKNFKTRSAKVEYTQVFSTSYETLKLELVKSTNDICTRDNLTIKCELTLNAGEEYVYSYTVESTGR